MSVTPGLATFEPRTGIARVSGRVYCAFVHTLRHAAVMIVKEYSTKPAQFRFPRWAHEFLAQESAATGASKTEIITEALAAYRTKRFEESMIEGYVAMADENLADAKLWEGALMDGMGPEEW